MVGTLLRLGQARTRPRFATGKRTRCGDQRQVSLPAHFRTGQVVSASREELMFQMITARGWDSAIGVAFSFFFFCFIFFFGFSTSLFFDLFSKTVGIDFTLGSTCPPFSRRTRRMELLLRGSSGSPPTARWPPKRRVPLNSVGHVCKVHVHFRAKDSPGQVRVGLFWEFGLFSL